MSKLIIFGTGVVGKLAQYYFQKDTSYEVVAFTVDKKYVSGEMFRELPLVPFEEVTKFYPPPEFKMFIAIGYNGMNKVRADKYYKAKALGYELVSYVSSKCIYLTDNYPGDNCFILEGNVIQPFVKIGSNVTLWSGNHIGHDSIIEDHCFITSHVIISGNVVIKPYCFFGVNATLRDAITIASHTFVGPGAIITGDTLENGVYLTGRAKLSSQKSEEVKI